MKKIIGILLPTTSISKIPSLGFSSISNILHQAFPTFQITPVYLDTKKPPDCDIFIFNTYSAWGMIELQRIFDRWDWTKHSSHRFCKVIIGGTGIYNPLPFLHLLDYVCLSEEALVHLVSKITKIKPKSWKRPQLIWAKSSYLTCIMPAQGCRYRCTFCQLVVHYNFAFSYSPLEEIKKVIEKEQPKRIQVHAASILQYPYFFELSDLLEQSKAKIYFGSMNLIEINEERASALIRLNPRHTVGVENVTNDTQAYFGLETGNPYILRVVRKPLSIPAAIEKVKILKKCGFSRVGFYLILGYPETDFRSFKLTAGLLNTFSNILGRNSRIRIKCTPFLPHLGTFDKDKPARGVFEYLEEYRFLVKNTNRNIIYDISDSFYYLSNLILMRGSREHSRLVKILASTKNTMFDNDKKMSKILKELNLPPLVIYLRGRNPLDLSSVRDNYISAQDAVNRIYK